MKLHMLTHVKPCVCVWPFACGPAWERNWGAWEGRAGFGDWGSGCTGERGGARVGGLLMDWCLPGIIVDVSVL